MMNLPIDSIPEKLRRKKEIKPNPLSFSLYPFESFTNHPKAWLNWMTKTNYQITNENLKEAIKTYFNKKQEKYEVSKA